MDGTTPRDGKRAALFRVPFVCGLILAGGAASGAEAGCEQLPEPRRTLCFKVLSCMMVEDADVRRACIDAAQREPAPAVQQREATPEPEAEPAPPVVQEEPVRQAEPITPSVRAEPVYTEAPPPTQAPAPVVHEDTRPVSSVAPPAPPNQFSGTVSRLYQSILDRQLIAVDSRYVFTSDRAAHARIKQGDRVDLAKISSRFWSGRRWRITGPSRTAIVATRIRCESREIRAEDRRKCEQMLDR